ncbi:MAG: hypothetical protein HZA46_24445 [Planctomycetales bacterium]|nr:hypothetical protein [Planctomycetales bacterium]
MPRMAVHSQIVLLLVSSLLAGCALCPRWNSSKFFTQRNPYGPRARCELPPQPTQQDVVAHLNRNIARVNSWRCTSAKITSRERGAVPMSLSAVIAVEGDRNFRLTANNPFGGREVDLGSNGERFWFWSPRNDPKHVFTARHEQLAQAQEYFPMPFQPDWLMEVLGVIPIDETEVTLEPYEPGARQGTLVAHRISPQGEPVTKLTVIDLCHGLVLEHSLVDQRGRLIAKATLRDHWPDVATGVVLPRHIDIDWPQARLGLALAFGAIEINPPTIPEPTWSMPVVPGFPPLDLARLAEAAGR